MAVTSTRFNHTLTLLNTGAVDIDTLKVMLLSNAATFTAAHTTLDQVAGALDGDPEERPYEVYGNGWAQGGVLLENVEWSTVAADVDTVPNDSMLDADNVSVTATGGPIGPGRKAVVYDDSHVNKAVLLFIDFGEDQTAGEDTDFKINWSSNGLLRERDYPA